MQAVREGSGGNTRLFIQLIDFLSIKRRPERTKFLERFLVIDEGLRERARAHLGDDAFMHMEESSVRARLVGLETDALREILSPRDLESIEMGFRERVTDEHLPHVAELPRVLPALFAYAAARPEEAGFDGVRRGGSC